MLGMCEALGLISRLKKKKLKQKRKSIVRSLVSLLSFSLVTSYKTYTTRILILI
jgi:hypothetical protein